MANNLNQVYLNTASCGLIPASVLQAGTELYKNFESNSSRTSEHWRDIEGPRIKENLAQFLQAAPADVALIPNCSYGINAVVHALRGDEKVLLYKRDFPSVYIPFLINHFDITWIEDEDDFVIDLQQIEALIHQHQINIVAISHVQWLSGFKIDLPALCRLCRENNVHTIIDATQSLGALSIAIPQTTPDVLLASSYKWMNAGFGTGLMYLSPDFSEKYPPKVSGAHSSAFDYATNTFTYNHSTTNYEPGSVNMFGFSVLNKAVEEKMQRGITHIEAHNTELTRLLLDKLASLPVRIIGPADLASRSSIVVIKDAKGLHEYLSQNGFVTTARNGTVRISIHAHNTEAEITDFTNCVHAWFTR